MTAHDLPTPQDVQLDLERIVHNLDKFWTLRLDSLAALPTIRAWRSPAKTKVLPPKTEAERRAYAIENLIEELTPHLPYEEDQKGVSALFTFGEPDKSIKARHEEAGKARGVSGDAFRMSHESRLLSKLAVDIYRMQLAWCMRQIDLDRVGIHTPSQARWWSLVEIDWTFSIPDDEPTTGIWDLRHVLRCVAPVAQPVAVITIKWTGNAPQSMSQIEPLSGPKPDDDDAKLPHKLLNLRPGSVTSVDDTAYVWDLGDPLLAGDEIELRWRERLPGGAHLGAPFLGVSTTHKPDLRFIRLRAQVVDPIRPRSEEWAEYTTSTSSYEAPSVKLLKAEPVERDSEGYFTYVPDPIINGHRYELWWGKDE